MKKAFTLAVLIFILIFNTYTIFAKEDNDSSLSVSRYAKDDLRDILATILQPYTQKAINDYYEKYLNHLPTEDPWFVEILGIDRPKNYEFLIKIKVAPYIGPHNTVGIDEITFKLTPSGQVTLENYEHIKSFSIPPNYKNIIKQWPPEDDL